MGGILDQIMASSGGAAPAEELPPSFPDPEPGMMEGGMMGGQQGEMMGGESGGMMGGGMMGGQQGSPAAPASEVQTLKEMLGLADTYGQISTVTEQERAQIEQARTILQKLLASNEKMSDQMTGATPALRKAFGG